MLNKNRWINIYIDLKAAVHQYNPARRKPAYIDSDSDIASPCDLSFSYHSLFCLSLVDKNKSSLKRKLTHPGFWKSVWKVSVSDFSLDVCCEYANKLQIRNIPKARHNWMFGCWLSFSMVNYLVSRGCKTLLELNSC